MEIRIVQCVGNSLMVAIPAVYARNMQITKGSKVIVESHVSHDPMDKERFYVTIRKVKKR